MPGGKWQVSVKGGSFPVWSRDGKELYFVATKVPPTIRCTIPTERCLRFRRYFGPLLLQGRTRTVYAPPVAMILISDSCCATDDVGMQKTPPQGVLRGVKVRQSTFMKENVPLEKANIYLEKVNYL